MTERKGPLLKQGYVSGGYLGHLLPGLSARGDSVPADETTDEYWMREALVESLESVGRCNPNPAVGCVVVRDGVELARGHTQPYGGRHAESEALARVRSTDLSGATAYVTLEPCAHFGHQPPCVDLLARSPIASVVIGRADPDSRVSGEGIRRLRQAGKKVRVGVLSEEITAWNQPFFQSRGVGPAGPFIALKWAQTLDGQLADDTGRSQWISGREARAYTHWLRQRYDAVMVGAGTWLADKPKLTVRDCARIQRQPLRLVYDPSGRALAEFQGGEDEAQVLFLIRASRTELLREKSGARAIPLEGASFGEQLRGALAHPAVAEALGKPLQSVLVEGGPTLLTQLVREDFADVIHAFIAPRLTGGKRYRVEPGFNLDGSRDFRLLSTEPLGQDVLAELVAGRSWERATAGAAPSGCRD